MATKEEILESISNMSVMDLVDLISDIEEKFGVTAAAAVAAAPAACRRHQPLGHAWQRLHQRHAAFPASCARACTGRQGRIRADMGRACQIQLFQQSLGHAWQRHRPQHAASQASVARPGLGS